jgi:hypothetical protein
VKVQHQITSPCGVQAWDAPGTGLIINERLVNCPPQLAPPLVQALFDEVGWAVEDEPQVTWQWPNQLLGKLSACTSLSVWMFVRTINAPVVEDANFSCCIHARMRSLTVRVAA